MPRLDEQVLLPDTTNPLIERLLLKTYLLEQGDPAHESIRPALIVHGGGMRGVYSTGVTAKFEDLGLSDTLIMLSVFRLEHVQLRTFCPDKPAVVHRYTMTI
jgi:hypothetical protein